MVAQEIYKFPWGKYNDDGINIENDSFFMDTVKDWEIDFHKKHPIFYANYFFANSSTMILLKKCLNLQDNYTCGMDLIDGRVDLETNLEIEKHSEQNTVYAFGSEIEENKEESLFLVNDDKISDGTVILKYIPDNDSDEIDTPITVDCDVIKI
jgi:hypothetical protein